MANVVRLRGRTRRAEKGNFEWLGDERSCDDAATRDDAANIPDLVFCDFYQSKQMSELL